MTAADKIATARALIAGRRWREDESALRDTVAELTDLADALAQENARLKATIRALDLVLERSGYAPSSLAREAIRAALGETP